MLSGVWHPVPSYVERIVSARVLVCSDETAREFLPFMPSSNREPTALPFFCPASIGVE